MRILIVEDEKKFLDILQRSLRGEGYTVDGVGTAADAVEYLKSYHYDLVIMDLQLPDGTGNSLLRRLRESGHTMPVLVLTARSELESKVEIFQAGADDYVVKPVAMAELAIRVQALMRRGPALQENVLKARDLEIKPADAPGQARRQAHRTQSQGIFAAGIHVPASGARAVAQHDRGKDLGPVL